MMNENWPRWIFASISKHFNSKKGDCELTVQGTDTVDLQKLKELAELNYTGPLFEEESINYWRADIIVLIAIIVKRTDNNFHRIHQLSGRFGKAFDRCIPVMKYGDGPDDDPLTQVGYLQIVDRNNSTIEVENLGQPDPDLPLEEVHVSGHYKIYLTAEE